MKPHRAPFFLSSSLSLRRLKRATTKSTEPISFFLSFFLLSHTFSKSNSLIIFPSLGLSPLIIIPCFWVINKRAACFFFTQLWPRWKAGTSVPYNERNEGRKEGKKEEMNEWMNEGRNEWMKEWMKERKKEWMNERMKEWMNEGMEGRNQWIINK